ncbi:hypothetical protein O3P69_006499 [Scylla paramamosain]|uniref:Uncharacterized protein n=1 Tax=Scylla paramamosain TaxID=85552 RepID=A0AAW0U2Q8_SCYPA
MVADEFHSISWAAIFLYCPIMTILRGWRYSLFLGGLIGFIGATLYPIVIYPMMNSSQYKQAQIENRRGINQEEIQPGNMNVWSDPFDRKK